MSEEALLQSIVADPANAATIWLVLADWLEERSDPRAELVRLTHDPNFRPRLSVAERQERVQELLTAGVRPCVPTRTNSLGMRFAWCPPGAFLMSSPPDEERREDDELQHRVTLTKGFFLGITVVTQGQWQAVMGHNPSYFKGGDLPVETVTWDECQKFCRRLTGREGRHYRLPTEAEWEYACRAGTRTPFHFGPTISTDQANYNGKYTYGKGKKGVYRGQTALVGSFPANAWGLLDMHGNVQEWCQDSYGPYPLMDAEDPLFKDGAGRVLRGGSWGGHPRICRSARRSWRPAAYSYRYVGCRVVLGLD